MVRGRKKEVQVQIEEEAAASSSENSASSSPVPAVAPPLRKRGRRMTIATNKVEQDRFCQSIRDSICDAIRGAYESGSDDSDMGRFCRQLKAAYQKLRTKYPAQIKDSYIGEIQFRLGFMVENLNKPEHRHSVFKLLVVSAINIYKDLGTMEVLECLVNYCAELHFCESSSVRQNIVTLIGYLFQYWSHTTEKDIAMSPSIRNELYAILLDRQLDKVVAVRAEVTRSARHLQEDDIPNDFEPAIERSPKEIIMMGLRDVAPECRLASVQSIDLSAKIAEQIDAIIDVATSEKVNKVRLAAMKSLGRLNPNSISSEQLMDLLTCTLNDCDEKMKDAAHTLILGRWLTIIASAQRKKIARSRDEESDVLAAMDDERDHGLGVAAQLLIGKLHWLEEAAAVRQICFCCLDVMRELLGGERVMVVSDLIISLSHDTTTPALVMQHNYKDVLNRQHSPSRQAHLIFFWRCLVEYCHERTISSDTEASKHLEVQRQECLHRLTPTLKTMCDVVKRLTQLDSLEQFETTDEELVALQLKQVSVRELLTICTFLDRDTVGMNEWKYTLETLLSDISLKKDLTDHIMEVLLDVHYKDAPEDALTTISDITASIVHRDINPDATMMNQTVSLPVNMTLTAATVPESKEEIIEYCMQLTNSLLKTGAFKKMHPVLRDASEHLICDCIKSNIEEIRHWAIESTGIMCMIEERMAKVSLDFMLTAMKDTMPVKLTCLDIICDWIITYGYESVNSWTKAFDHISRIYSEIIASKLPDEDMCFKACECAAKILLLRARDPEQPHWIILTTSLLMRLFHPSAAKKASMKACLSQFFLLFSSTRRTNQMMLVKAFMYLLFTLTTERNEENIFLNKLNVERALLCITQWTRSSVLVAEDSVQPGQPPVHSELLWLIMLYLDDHPEDTYTRLYCQTASILELEGIQQNRLTEFRDGYRVIHKFVSEIEGEKSKPALDIKKLLRRLDVALTDDTQSQPPNDEADDTLTALPEARTPGRRRPLATSTPMESNKKAPSAAKKTKVTVDVDIPDSPEDPKPAPEPERKPPARAVKKVFVRTALFKD